MDSNDKLVAEVAARILTLSDVEPSDELVVVGYGDIPHASIIKVSEVHPGSGMRDATVVTDDGMILFAFDLGLAPQIQKNGSERWNQNFVCFKRSRFIKWRILHWLSSFDTSGARDSRYMLCRILPSS